MYNLADRKLHTQTRHDIDDGRALGFYDGWISLRTINALFAPFVLNDRNILVAGDPKRQRPFNHQTVDRPPLQRTCAGLSKVQYFYIPALVLVCRGARLRARRRTPWWLVAALCLAQAVCLLPAQEPYLGSWSHTDPFFGSYAVWNPPPSRARIGR